MKFRGPAARLHASDFLSIARGLPTARMTVGESGRRLPRAAVAPIVVRSRGSSSRLLARPGLSWLRFARPQKDAPANKVVVCHGKRDDDGQPPPRRAVDLLQTTICVSPNRGLGSAGCREREASGEEVGKRERLLLCSGDGNELRGCPRFCGPWVLYTGLPSHTGRQ